MQTPLRVDFLFTALPRCSCRTRFLIVHSTLFLLDVIPVLASTVNFSLLKTTTGPLLTRHSLRPGIFPRAVQHVLAERGPGPGVGGGLQRVRVAGQRADPCQGLQLHRALQRAALPALHLPAAHLAGEDLNFKIKITNSAFLLKVCGFCFSKAFLSSASLGPL